MYRLILLPFLFLSLVLKAQDNSNWAIEKDPVPAFIENQGQFEVRHGDQPNEAILYAYDGSKENFYFTKSGMVLELIKQQKVVKSEAEKKARKAKKKVGFKDGLEYRAFENDGHRLTIETDQLYIQWLNTNPQSSIQMEDKNNYSHAYAVVGEDGNWIDKNNISSYQKLVYKDLYPNIDVIYEIHPQAGYKYSLVLHPGADLANVALTYSKDISLRSNGEIHSLSHFGDIVDHAPLTFYEDNPTEIIASEYSVNGNTIGFSLANYDPNRTVIIDPWTESPNFTNTGWDCVWECERDAAGNAYLIGGTSPLQLIKYNAAGALQWTFNTPYDTTEWLGTFAVDQAGNSYVSNGSPARIFMRSTANTAIWTNNSPGGLLALTEFWNITFNCDETRLVIAGTDGGAFGGPQPYIFDIDMASGNVITSVKVHGGGLFAPQEVRSITPCNNAKYYFLTHDSIGWIHQSLTACVGAPNDIFHVDNGISLGYKCEDWRYNNAGIMAIAHYNGFIYVHRGNQLQKRDFATANVLATVTIPGGVFNSGFGGSNVENSGIDIDDCGNIFVGSTNGVYRFDQNLNQTGNFATAFNVYDVEVSSGGDVIAGGSTGNSNSGARSGFLQSFAVGACAQQTIVCCDATICPIDPLCTDDSPIVVSPLTPGGAFTASCGACINAVTGLFDPAAAGQGLHSILYTLPCGSDSVKIQVNTCTVMSVCQEADNSYSVSGGTPAYDWFYLDPGGTLTITDQASCEACGGSWSAFGGSCSTGGFGGSTITSCPVPPNWQQFNTGINIPEPSSFPIRVVNGNNDTLEITNAGSVPSCGPLLDIELLEFDAFPTREKSVQTIWSTANEEDCAVFEVERSQDGLEWEKAARLNCQNKGAITQFYNFEDRQAYSAQSYYRLKMEKQDESISYSEIKSVYLSEKGDYIHIYPNPTNSNLVVDFGIIPDGEVLLRLYDALGRELTIDYHTTGAQYFLNLNQVSAGHYFLQIQKGHLSYLRKVEKR